MQPTQSSNIFSAVKSKTHLLFGARLKNSRPHNTGNNLIFARYLSERFSKCEVERLGRRHDEGWMPLASRTATPADELSEVSLALAGSRDLRIPYSSFRLFVIGADAAIITASSLASGVIYHLTAFGGRGSVETFIAIGCMVSANFCAVCLACGSYTPQRLSNVRKQVGDVLAAWSLVGFALLTVAFLLKTTETFSRGSTITFFVV